VPEYWLADPKTRSVTVYTLSQKTDVYEELGRFGPEDRVRSVVVEGFETPVAPLFPPRKP
jgi:Uma2 family endonuclease